MQEAEADGAEDDLGVGDEEETPDLLELDPKEWKVRTTFKSFCVYFASVHRLFGNCERVPLMEV